MERVNRILTINSGSSSIKFSLYHMGQDETLLFGGKIERIGLSPSLFHVKDAEGKTLIDQQSDLHDQDASLKLLFDWLGRSGSIKSLDTVGHQVVHGVIWDREVKKLATLIRYYILAMSTEAGSGHPTPSLSATDRSLSPLQKALHGLKTGTYY